MWRSIVLALPLVLGGCVVSTAAKVVTAPVRAAAKGVDLATTSQEEADRNLGREVRKERERAAKEQKRRERDAER